MGAFDLADSVRRAERRIGPPTREPGRLARSDRGRSRLDPRALAAVAAVFSDLERPGMAQALAEIAKRCRRARVRPPSRATAYKLLDTLPTHSYRFEDLPPAVQDALYNLSPGSEVPGHQVAFYAFNYGDLSALSFASGLPWLALHQALNLPGWRARSRGLAEAVARARGIR